jgi:hypothetical protein
LKRGTAKLAFSFHHVHFKDIKVCSMNDLSIAGRTKSRISNMAWDVPNVNIF